MNNFAEYLTSENYIKLCKEVGSLTEPLEVLKKRASAPKELCEICQIEYIWRLADTGMCFSCTTGEADASSDYELKETP